MIIAGIYCITTLETCWQFTVRQFRLINSSLIRRENNSLRRKCIERAVISKFSTVNLRTALYTISPIIPKEFVAQCSIRTIRGQKRRYIRSKLISDPVDVKDFNTEEKKKNILASDKDVSYLQLTIFSHGFISQIQLL